MGQQLEDAATVQQSVAVIEKVDTGSLNCTLTVALPTSGHDAEAVKAKLSD